MVTNRSLLGQLGSEVKLSCDLTEVRGGHVTQQTLVMGDNKAITLSYVVYPQSNDIQSLHSVRVDPKIDMATQPFLKFDMRHNAEATQ